MANLDTNSWQMVHNIGSRKKGNWHLDTTKGEGEGLGDWLNW